MLNTLDVFQHLIAIQSKPLTWLMWFKSSTY